MRRTLAKKEQLVKVTLMQADLDFEYPQKLERLLVRSEILAWLDEEEEKLKSLALQQFVEQEATEVRRAKRTPGDEFYLTYDDYYGNREQVQTRSMQAGSLFDSGKISYEQFVTKQASTNIFDNDLLEQQYKFWETPTDKETRLKRLWIDLNRQNALGGIDAPTTDE